MPATLDYIFVHYPTPTQTFLEREMNALRERGFRIRIRSLMGPREAEGVDYFGWGETFKVLVALPRECLRDRNLLGDAWRVWREHRPRTFENFVSVVRATAFALCRAAELRARPPGVIHGVWATGPATAAAILGRLCGVPFSLGAHARDIYAHGGDAFLRAKMRAAAFVHTTTQANVQYLREKAGGDVVNIVLARRGLERLPGSSPRNRPAGPIRILSVGRLVPKKGHVFQLAAGAWLQANQVPFELRIVGDGPQRPKLQAVIDSLGLAGKARLLGAVPSATMDEQYRWADLFWHTGIVADDGDRDGLPNVIPEAFAHGLPVICGHEPGATEAVEHERTGLVVDVTDAEALASAVKRLAQDEPMRRRLGANGRRWVEANFLASRNAAILARAFQDAVAERSTP